MDDSQQEHVTIPSHDRSATLSQPTAAVDIATPLNLTARRRRRRHSTAAKLSASLNDTSGQVSAQLKPSRASPSTQGPTPPPSRVAMPDDGLDRQPVETIARAKVPSTNLASRRQRRAERRLSASRLQGQQRLEEQAHPDPSLLLVDSVAATPDATDAHVSLPGGVSAS